MTENVVVGIVSGLTVSILVVFVRQFWRAVVIPWFEERIYKDMHIEGKWFSVYPEDTYIRRETISLKRHGHQIKGTIICNGGPDEGEEYKVEGSFRNLILPLVYETDDKTKSDRGAITLRAENNGMRLAGKMAGYHTPSDSIKTIEVVWVRSKDEHEAIIKRIEDHREELRRINEEREELDEKHEHLIEGDQEETDENKEQE